MAGNFQVSSKLPDGRIFVVAGETYQEFKQNLNNILGEMDAENMVTTMASSFIGVQGVHTTYSSTPQVSTTTSSGPTLEQANANIAAAFPGSTSTTAHASSGKQCIHGPMTKREGSSAKGPWKAFMCPTPKGTLDQCDAVFIKRGTPEWSTF